MSDYVLGLSMSFGPCPDWKKFKFGQCKECFDQITHRKNGTIVEGTEKLRCNKCGDVWPKFKRRHQLKCRLFETKSFVEI